MNLKPPEAFVGYAWNPALGFVQLICQQCFDHKRAEVEAKDTPWRAFICQRHIYAMTCKRMGEAA